MTFNEANSLIRHEDPYEFSEEERRAFESFNIKLTHYICEKCEHLKDKCKAIDCIDGESFAITSCSYFLVRNKEKI